MQCGRTRGGWLYPWCALLTAMFLGNMTMAQRAGAQIFYPQPPDPPRIQLLTIIRSEADLKPRQGWFKRFLFGKELDRASAARALDKPYGVAFRDGRLLIGDLDTGSYWVLDPVERTLRMAEDPPGTAGIQQAVGMATDERGQILVTDPFRKELLVFSAPGTLDLHLGGDVLERPVGVAVSGQQALVADTRGYRVVSFDLATREHRILLGNGAEGTAPLVGPSDVCFALDGSFYVAETLGGIVRRFSTDGTLLNTVGERGAQFGAFGVPKGLAVDRQGRLYVTDAQLMRVQLFDDQGRLLLIFGRLGDPETDILLPAGIAIDYGGVEHWREYAAEGFNLEYVLAIVTTGNTPAVYVYGFGRMTGVEYPEDPPPASP